VARSARPLIYHFDAQAADGEKSLPEPVGLDSSPSRCSGMEIPPFDRLRAGYSEDSIRTGFVKRQNEMGVIYRQGTIYKAVNRFLERYVWICI